MAFPQEQTADRATTDNTATTSHDMNLPANISDGDTVTVICCFEGDAGAITPPSGWNEEADDGDGIVSGYCISRLCDGTEGSTVTVTTGNSVGGGAIARRYTGASGNVEANITSTSTNDANPDPPSLTPSWGAKDTVWEAAFVTGGDRALNSYPTDYVNGEYERAQAAANDSAVGSATRDLNASSEDPGTFTLSANASWLGITVAIEPEAAAPSLTNASADASSSTEVEASVDTDTGSGTLYWIVDQSSTKPSVAQIQAGNDSGGSAADASGSQAISTTGTKSIEGTGVATHTEFFVHFQQDDGSGNDSSVVTTSGITTAYAAPGLSLSQGTGVGEADGTLTDNTGGSAAHEIRYGEQGGGSLDGRTPLAAGETSFTIQADPGETIDAEAYAVDDTLPPGSGRYSDSSGTTTQVTLSVSIPVFYHHYNMLAA